MGLGWRTVSFCVLTALALYKWGTPADESAHRVTAAKPVRKPATISAQPRSNNLRIPPIEAEPAVAAQRSRLEGFSEMPLNEELADARERMREMRGRLSFDLRDIEVLEAAWPELRMSAIAEALPEGWILTFVEPDSVFADLGFHEADVVLKSQLTETFAGQDPEQLERLERILNYIAR